MITRIKEKIVCPKNDKHCDICLIYKSKGKDYICSGINKKPSIYKGDKIKLCIVAEKSNRVYEMTTEEASFIISVLSSTLGNLAPATLRKIKCRQK
jgi:hypothetical protein